MMRSVLILLLVTCSHALIPLTALRTASPISSSISIPIYRPHRVSGIRISKMKISRRSCLTPQMDASSEGASEGAISAPTPTSTIGSPTPLTTPTLTLPTWRSPTGRPDELFREVMAGLVVALATIPTSISYSTVIGVNPITGIWNSAIVGFIVTLIGGAPGMVAGAAGVIALPMAKLVNQLGLPYMSAAVVLSALLQIAFGAARLSRLMDVVTPPVIAGFMNALGFFLLQTQLKIFCPAGVWLPLPILLPSIATAAFCAATTQLLPRIGTSPIPPSLVGLVGSSLLAVALGFPIKTLADTVGGSKFVGGLAALPSFTGLPDVPFSSATLGLIASTAVGTAVICIVETLLAQRISLQKYRSQSPTGIYEKNDYNKAALGMGFGNLVASLFGGFGGCGLIPNTLLCGASGGVGYASGFSYALCTAAAVVCASPLLGRMPMAALAGVMLTVGVKTIEWGESVRILRGAVGWEGGAGGEVSESTDIGPDRLQQLADLLSMLTSTFLCYRVDMGVGVAVGVLIAKLPFLSCNVLQQCGVSGVGSEKTFN
ncbi:sulfate transporter family-domain-containing protein [Ochromonadaceae sp. CCMP2298]|nr:sulfate transporter family-domain-containing protein [Ochromonadaceae sp. CCMP2298]